jgi:nanoRNase/pAp phosphatase (c-di-AMP/oligoRNAs hydrolase)
MPLQTFNYRLITRSDFDGLVSAALLRELQMLDDIMFVHPKDMQDGLIAVTSRDIITNLPYVASCHLCFDHHHSEALRHGNITRQNFILDPDADSAARVVFNYFGGASRFPGISYEMMEAVDKCDSARFTREDVLAPKRWDLLNFIMDPRTGLGRFRDFRISNYQLMMALVDYCRSHSIEDILHLQDVRERVELYNLQRQDYCEQIARCSGVYGNVAVIDLRKEELIYCGNRFLAYALLPECNVSVHLLRSRQPGMTVLAVGKSIFSRTNPVDVGELMLQHGGGGHSAAGTCQIASDEADALVPLIVESLNLNSDTEILHPEPAGMACARN